MQVGGLGGALSAGLAGIQKGEQQLTQAAQQVASASTDRPVSPNQDVAKALIEEKEGQRQIEMSANVVKTADETLGSLVDIKV